MKNNVKNIPQQKRLLLKQLVDQLSGIPDMAAIVLGGSYASGTHHETSDLDIGLYYFENKPFSSFPSGTEILGSVRIAVK